MDNSKSLNRMDIFFGIVTALIFVDIIAANASLGPSLITWWLIIGLLVMIPNGLITAELGSKYPDRGGIYSWISKAFGPKWAARTSWIYWSNNTLWVPSALIWVSGLMFDIFMPEADFIWFIILCIVLIWIIIWVCSLKISESKWISNISAITKFTLFGLIIVSGIIVLLRGEPSANEFSFKTIMPSLDSGLFYLPVIIFLCFGLEILSASAHEMKNPKKDVPFAVISVAILTIVSYVLASWAMLTILPIEEINLITAPLDIILIAFNSEVLYYIAAVLLIYSVLSQVTVWVLGTCIGASESGEAGELPKSFGINSKKTGAPIGSLIITGIIASAAVIIYGFMADGAEDLFYTLFAFTSVLFFVPYIIMHSAYRKLKMNEPKIQDVFVAPLGRLFSYSCQFFLIIGMILFVWTPGQPIDTLYTGSIIGGIVITIVIGEIIIHKQLKNN